jgi:7-carboxy-7-deazaguanine synthase
VKVISVRRDDRRDESPTAGQTRGYLSEIFCSVQGEGLHVGEPQIFFRTAGCSQACTWCDTLYSKVRVPRCVIRNRDGRVERTVPNPLLVETGVSEVMGLVRENPAARTVSITGGEPLEQADFVTETAVRIKSEGLSVYLETAGFHAREFAEILPYVDVVAMDIKLPSAIGAAAWDEHAAFLSCIDGTPFDPGASPPGGGTKRIFVKVVVDGNSRLDEIESAARLIASSDSRIPLILQPESNLFMSERSDREEVKRLNGALVDFREAASRLLSDVRVVPQVHKILNVR